MGRVHRGNRTTAPPQRTHIVPFRALRMGCSLRMRPISNVAGFDDGPFARNSLEPVRLVGVICARTRLDGVLSGWVQRNGEDATERMAELIEHSQFADYVRAVLLKGIAVAGFN